MRYALLVTLSLAAACTPGTEVADQEGVVPNGIDTPTQQQPVVGDEPTNTSAWPTYRSFQATAEGTMITAGQLDGHETTGYLSAQYSLGFTFDVFTPEGWAMVGGDLVLYEPLKAGQHLEINPENTIGCSGVDPGAFDFDGPALSGEIVVAEGDMRDQLVLFITADFGAGGQVAVTATAGATD